MITAVPAMASQSAYYDASIKMTNQDSQSITFSADTVPTINLSVYIVVQEMN